MGWGGREAPCIAALSFARWGKAGDSLAQRDDSHKQAKASALICVKTPHPNSPLCSTSWGCPLGFRKRQQPPQRCPQHPRSAGSASCSMRLFSLAWQLFPDPPCPQEGNPILPSHLFSFLPAPDFCTVGTKLDPRIPGEDIMPWINNSNNLI